MRDRENRCVFKLPFGEELFAGTGGRTTAQGYSASDGIRQHFTQKERDNETGLDYFSSRYYASTQGRFASADSVAGTLSNPQSFNRYSYTQNDPVNSVDPDGLDAVGDGRSLLQNASCRSLFGKTNPFTLLDNLIKRNHIMVSNQYPRISSFRGNRFVGFSQFRPFGSDAMVTRDVTLHPALSGPERNPYIFISSAIVTQLESGMYTYGGRFEGLSGEKIVGVMLIHELLHAAGRIPHDSGGTPQANAQSHLNDLLVKIFCVTIPHQPVTTNTAVPNNSPIIRGGGGGGGGGFGGGGGGFGGGYPFWMSSMWGFLNWVNSIPVGGGYVTVSYCIGHECGHSEE